MRSRPIVVLSIFFSILLVSSPIFLSLPLARATSQGNLATKANGFSFSDFSSTSQLNLNGSAARATDVLRLTSSAGSGSQAGSAWYMTKQNVTNGFSTTFDFQITPPNGADGFAFVVQNHAPGALGGSGGGLGYNGIPDSLAVEFDTYQNGAHFFDATQLHDISDHEIAIHTNGLNPNSADESSAISPGPTISPMQFQKDGNVHSVKVLYALGVLEIFLDDFASPVLASSLNLADTLSLPDGTIFVGFTAGSGNQGDNHDILDWTFNTLMAGSNIVQNGDFSNGLLGWTPVRSANVSGVAGQYPIFKTATQMPIPTVCTPASERGTPFLTIQTPFDSSGYVEQLLTIPRGAHLSLTSWGWEDLDAQTGANGGVNATVSIVDGYGNVHLLETFIPPPVFNPGNPFSPCTGNNPVKKSYDLSAFEGQPVKLRLGSSSSNCCGAIAAFAQVDVEAPQNAVFLCPPRAGFQALENSCALPNSRTGQPYSYRLHVQGGTLPYTFSTDSGIVPPGTTLEKNGNIVGVPNQPGVFPFNVTFSDSGFSSFLIPVTITITPVVTEVSPAAGLVTGGSSVNITGVGFSPPPIGSSDDVRFNSTSVNGQFTVNTDSMISVTSTPSNRDCTLLLLCNDHPGPATVTVVVNGQPSAIWCVPNFTARYHQNCNKFDYLPRDNYNCSVLTSGGSISLNNVNFHASLDASPVVADAEFSGSLQVTPHFEFCVRAAGGNLESFSFNSTTNVSALISARISLAGVYDNTNKPFVLAGPFVGPTLVAGPVIMVPTVTPVLIVTAGLGGALTAGIDFDSTRTFAITYNPGNSTWSNTANSIACNVSPATGRAAMPGDLCIQSTFAASFDGHIKVALGFEFGLLFYGVVGPVVTPDVYLSLDGGASSTVSSGASTCNGATEGTQPGSWAAICGGLELAVGVQVSSWLSYLVSSSTWTAARFDLGSTLLASSISIKPSDPSTIILADGTLKVPLGASVALTTIVAGSRLSNVAAGTSWIPIVTKIGCTGSLTEGSRAGDSIYTAPYSPEDCYLTFSKSLGGLIPSIGLLSTSSTAHIQVGERFSYRMSNSGDVNVARGGSATVLISASLTGGVGSIVTLACDSSTLPSGTFCSFDPNSVTPTGSSQLTVHTSSSTPAGSYLIRVISAPAATTPTTFRLNVSDTQVSVRTKAGTNETSARPTIFGLDPAAFYSITGVAAALIAAAGIVAIRTRRKH